MIVLDYSRLGFATNFTKISQLSELAPPSRNDIFSQLQGRIKVVNLWSRAVCTISGHPLRFSRELRTIQGNNSSMLTNKNSISLRSPIWFQNTQWNKIYKIAPSTELVCIMLAFGGRVLFCTELMQAGWQAYFEFIGCEIRFRLVEIIIWALIKIGPYELQMHSVFIVFRPRKTDWISCLRLRGFLPPRRIGHALPLLAHV